MDEDEKEFARQDLTQLTKQADQEKIDLVYFDGSGFNLWAKVVSMVIKLSNLKSQISIISVRLSVLNYAHSSFNLKLGT